MLVIGAGAAGLGAARQLTRAGRSVLVLEAADRVGGRTHAVDTALGSRVDLGGQWVGHDHVILKELMSELGLDYYDMYNAKTPFRLVDGTELPEDSGTLREVFDALAVCEAASFAELPAAWESLTVAQWIGQQVSDPAAQRLLAMYCAVQTTSEIHLLSMKHWTEEIRAMGGFAAASATTGGPQESLIFKGLGAVSERMAEELGEKVHLGERVLAVKRTDGGYRVTTPAAQYQAAQVIVAVPAPLLPQIDFNGLLGEDLQHYAEHSYMGVVYKAMAVYERPFWRDRGDAEGALIGEVSASVADASPPGGPGHLTFLVGGADARAIAKLPLEARKAALLGQLAARVGEEILSPADWHDKAWFEDPFVGGGYSAQPRMTARGYHPPTTTDLGGGLFVAGTEFSTKHFGYVEGALETGYRAAAAALAGGTR